MVQGPHVKSEPIDTYSTSIATEGQGQCQFFIWPQLLPGPLTRHVEERDEHGEKLAHGAIAPAAEIAAAHDAWEEKNIWRL